VFFTVGILEDLVGSFGPDERVCAVVPAVDERADLGVEVADGPEGAAVDAGEVLLDRRTAVRGDPPLREEVVRPQRTAKEKARSYALLATPNL
jgi:hypothetical protein